MASSGGVASSTGRSLQETPTWALAAVCFVMISLGILIEHLIHLAGHWLKNHKKVSLYEAIQKLKSVLMQLGFMSLILTVTQRWVSKLCIPNDVADTMLPCRKAAESKTAKALQQYSTASATSVSPDHCASKGMSSLMSEEGISQLKIFIFVLAAMQIVYSTATMGLGSAKMRRWKSWEKETQTIEYMAANDPERFRFTRQTTFGRRHVSSCTNPVLLWIKCFFRQFFRSLAKIDYLTLRHGFISAHLSTDNSFNFQMYIQRSLEDDFKAVVGISPIMWFVAVIFLLVDVHGWNVYLWVSFLPLIIVLIVGAKLEVIVARMALQVTSQSNVIRGSPLVQLNNNLFWFSRPQLVLTLIHYILFMNAFEFSFFLWVTWQFGINSCYHENVLIIIVRVVLAVMVQVLCSYITLPLYALVTQMGSQYKIAILDEQTIHAIKEWHAKVKQKRKTELHPPSISQDGSSTALIKSRNVSPDTSSAHRRAPTLIELSKSKTHEITEIVQSQQDPSKQLESEEIVLGM